MGINDIVSNMNSVASTIIIPCQEISYLTRRCVQSCLKYYPDANIYVIPDSAPQIQENWSSYVSIIPSGVKNTAQKRNFAVFLVKTKYIAFIDDDAYPTERWLTAGISILKNDSTIGIVGGPGPAPDNEELSERCVGNARCSFFLTGPFVYRRQIAQARDCQKLSSCNMVMLRNTYLKVGGMDESLFTGDDTSLCKRILKQGLRLRYDPSVSVYHNNRNIKGFFLQSMVRSMDNWDLLRKYPTYDDFFGLIAALFTLALSVGALLLLIPSMRWQYLYFITICLMIIIIECFRVSRNLREVPGTIAAFMLGYLGTALGVLINPFKSWINSNKLYRNTKS